MEQVTDTSPNVPGLTESLVVAAPLIGLSFWVSTTHAALGTLFMAISNDYTAGAAMIVKLNCDESGDAFGGALSANKVSFRVKGDNGEYHNACFSMAGFFDGNKHHVVFWHDNGAMHCYVDGAAKTLTESATASPINGFTLDAFGFGEVGLGLSEVTAKVGEVVLLDRAPTAAEIAELAAGFSPRFMDPRPLRHCSLVPGDTRDLAGSVDWVSYAAVLDHPPIIEPADRIELAGADMVASYELYLKPGSPPDPDVDTPLMRLPKSATGASIAGYTFTPNVPHFVSVWPRNVNGLATSAPVASFPVDGSGIPRLAPECVTSLRATALQGGNVRIEWAYAESNPLTVAAQFEITLTPINITGQTPVIETVTHVASQPAYAVELGPLVSGLWEVEVRSIAASGAQVTAVQSVYVRADAAPPDEEVVGLEAA